MNRWEHLQLILEVYQFARDAAVAEAWLVAHEPYLLGDHYGDTLDTVEILIKKHEAFEKSAATQEERFAALERLTTFELRERQKAQEAEFRQQHPDAPFPQKTTLVQRYIDEFLPPPEPEPEPEPAPEPVKQAPEVVKAESPEARAVPSKEEKSPSEEGAGASSSDDQTCEGLLSRKHEWESTTKKASNRSWDKVYCVLSNKQLAAYKDQKHAKSDPTVYHRHEGPIDLNGASAFVATDYVKKPHVFRLKLANGGDFLFQCKDEAEMNSWIGRLNSATGTEPSSPTRAQTLPASSERGEQKKRSFFTLGKKKET